MDWTSLIGPAVIAATVSGIVTTIGFLVNRSTSLRMHEQKLDADRALAERKVEADIALAEQKLDLDRAMADWKRKSELAEQVLADFYKARDIFISARQPMAMGGEGSTRPRRPGESEEQANMRDAIYTPLERVNRERDFLSELNAKKFRMAAAFGLGVSEPFHVFVKSYNLLVLGTSHLLRDNSRLKDDTRQLYEGMIGWGVEDTIGEEINTAVATMEDICRPILQWKPV